MTDEPVTPSVLPIHDDADAERRFRLYEKTDPLEDVPPALLNSGDIYDYVRLTGMICPFPGDEGQLKKKLKSASYEIDFLGVVHYTDKQGLHRARVIKKGTPFTLEKNSIAYVYLDTVFRLPDYIALRFNLKITQVHQGLLLGTGPLVDPGFCGKLLIPLHNLTSKDYTIRGGDGLIWVEFTKLSPHISWNRKARKDSHSYTCFPDDKRHIDAQRYLDKSTEDGKPAVSSIRGEILAAREAAEKAKRYASLLFGAGVGGIAIALVGLVYPSWDIVSTASKNIADYRAELAQIDRKLAENHDETGRLIAGLAADLKSLRASESTKSSPPNSRKRRKNGK